MDVIFALALILFALILGYYFGKYNESHKIKKSGEE